MGPHRRVLLLEPLDLLLQLFDLLVQGLQVVHENQALPQPNIQRNKVLITKSSINLGEL